MGQLTRAIDYGNKFMTLYPKHKEEVQDYFQLMKDEISKGLSVENEINLFISACEDLLIIDQD